MKALALLLVVVTACTRSAAPSSTCPTVASSKPVVVDDAAPADDAALRKWKAIVADEFRVPANQTASALIPELVAYLGSPDPVRRDSIGFEVLARWIDKQVITDAELVALTAQLVEGTRSTDVYRRSFSILVLSQVVRRDARSPALSDDTRRAILAAVQDRAATETDLRGHVGAHGWIHVAAHSADLLYQLAKLPLFTDDDRAAMLDAIADFAVRRHGGNFHHGEDARLGTAAIAIVKKGVPRPALDKWLGKLAGPLAEHGGAEFDEALYAAQRNGRNLLFTLVGQVALVAAASEGERALLEALRTLLAN